MGWWSAAFSALGSALTGSSNRRQSQQQSRDGAARQQQQLMYGANVDRSLAMWSRGNELEDQRYRQSAIGNYAQFNRTPGIVRPELSSTTPTDLVLPAYPDKPKKSLLGAGQ